MSKREDVFIGRTADGEKVYVTAELSRQEPHEPHGQTVDHVDVDKPYIRLSLTGTIIRKGGSLSRDGDWLSTGQVVDDLRRVGGLLATGWTMAEVRRLADIWDRWHLNDMRAGCAHQPPESIVYEGAPWGRVDLDNTPRCPETGYKYGSAWLVEYLPADVVEFISDKFGIEVS